MVLTSFLGTFLVSAVSIALPEIERSYEMSAVELSMVMSVYLLAMAMFALPVGKWSDTMGRNRLFKVGLATFTIASFVCGVTNSEFLFLLFRFFQGVGATLTAVIGSAILVQIFPSQYRGSVLGLSVSAVYLGLATGPFLGGVITQIMGWRFLFLLAAVVAAVVEVFAIILLKNEEVYHAQHHTFDQKGTLLYMSALLMLVAGSARTATLLGQCLLVVSFLLFTMFLKVELSVTMPLFDVRLFRHNRLFLFSNIAALINYSATSAIVFLLSIYLQKFRLLSPYDAGLLLVTQPAVMALLSPLAGKLSDSVPARYLATSGMSLCTLGLAMFLFLEISTPLWLLALVLAWLGAGFALFSSPNTNTIMSSVEPSHYGVASGIAATMRVVGQIVSITIVTIFFAFTFQDRAISSVSPHLFLTVLQWLFGIFTVLCGIGTYFSFRREGQREKNNFPFIRPEK